MTRFCRAFAFAVMSLVATAPAARAEAPKAQDVLVNYANIAEATYGDALAAARALKEAIDTMLKSPTDETLAAARKAWKAARVPYMQSEAFRFGNPIVDGWEGRVNSWPLDEGLIDYVSEAYGGDNPENEFYAANVIANPHLKIGGQTVDASKITPALIRDTLQEAGGVEAMSRAAITPSNSCCGARICTAQKPAQANVLPPITISRPARTELRSPGGLSHGRHRSAD